MVQSCLGVIQTKVRSTLQLQIRSCICSFLAAIAQNHPGRSDEWWMICLRIQLRSLCSIKEYRWRKHVQTIKIYSNSIHIIPMYSNYVAWLSWCPCAIPFFNWETDHADKSSAQKVECFAQLCLALCGKLNLLWTWKSLLCVCLKMVTHSVSTSYIAILWWKHSAFTINMNKHSNFGVPNSCSSCSSASQFLVDLGRFFSDRHIDFGGILGEELRILRDTNGV